MRLNRYVVIAVLLLFGTVPAAFAAKSKPIPIKVVVMAMFERGELKGDSPGEMQLWLERGKFTTTHDFPLGEAQLYTREDGVMVILLGGGIPNATASTMALGMDRRFDLSQAYWLVAGIAGADPADLSLGSAAWARHVVDGDLLYEIDGREIPDHWPYGIVPLGGKEPTQNPSDIYTSWTLDTISFAMNPGLVNWAYDLTRSATLQDGPGVIEFRELYAGHPMAQKPPFVTIGDTLSSSTYWHGELLNNWANDWLKLYAGKDAEFMTSNMEDSGTLTALYRLARTGLVDTQRVLVLRTASNFTMPPKGKSAVWSKSAPYPDNGLPAIENAFIVGNIVVEALVDGWSTFADTPPQAEPPRTMIDPASMPGEGIQ